VTNNERFYYVAIWL